jgi:hypothetical protein
MKLNNKEKTTIEFINDDHCSGILYILKPYIGRKVRDGMELTADVSVIILLLGFTGLLAGYFFYFRPLFLHSAKPALMDETIVSQASAC